MPNDSAEPLIGVINAGSSSLKFSFYEGEKRLLSGQVDGIGVHPAAQAVGADGKAIAPPDFAGRLPASPSEVLPAMLPWAREQLGERRLAALGHRVVHGGPRHSKPAQVTPGLLDELEVLVPLAPLHEPHNLAPIRMALAMNPELPQVACFDTAFHRTAPEVAQAFALPYALYEEGIGATGFTGCHTNTSPRSCRSVLLKSPAAGLSSRIWEMAARPARYRRGGRWRRRWGSPRSTGCRWAPAAARSIPASFST